MILKDWDQSWRTLAEQELELLRHATTGTGAFGQSRPQLSVLIPAR